jgi:cohesin loading factor subunit SCC2
LWKVSPLTFQFFSSKSKGQINQSIHQSNKSTSYWTQLINYSEITEIFRFQLVDTPSANLVARHFASKRQFATSFDHYFRRILGMASDNATQIRIRAIKSVSTIIDADGALMGRLDVKNCVESRMFDTSASIRETVIEMIGKYSVLNPQHLEQYHQVLLKRLMDTAPSVRKRAIKVLHDFCVEWPDNDLCAGICGNIIKRIGDEEGIKKLVYEVFQVRKKRKRA